MRVTILALGTRGDVQPLLALGVGLQRTGRHQVRFAAPDNFAGLVGGHGLEFFPLGIDTRELLGTGTLAAGMESGRNLFLWVWQILRAMRPTFELLMERTWTACQGAESVAFSTMGFGAYHAAEKLGLPCCWAIPFPGMARTRAFPGVVFPRLRLGGTYNYWTHAVAEVFLHQLTGRFVNRWRRRMQLPVLPLSRWPYGQLHGRPLPILFSFSPLVVPRPPDWGDHVHVTGYWPLDPAPDWRPPARLVEFVQAGLPPVYLGFGSMAHRAPRQTARLVREALARSGQRGVFAAGWSGLEGDDSLSVDVFVLEEVPHAWLFPRTAAVVHHGGSGTTGAGLRAGVPSVLVPHTGDQFLWAQRVAELGVGPPAIPRRRLTVERLAEAIGRVVGDGAMQARAGALGERIRAEDGVGRAIALIEREGGIR